jgi:hypothetical protein
MRIDAKHGGRMRMEVKLGDIEGIASMAKMLGESLAKHRERKRNPRRWDKMGLGFNDDPRFCTVKINLSLDSWAGVYGDSGLYHVHLRW